MLMLSTSTLMFFFTIISPMVQYGKRLHDDVSDDASDHTFYSLLFIRSSADGSRRFENLYESSRLFDWIFCLQEVHFRQMQATIYMIR